MPDHSYQSMADEAANKANEIGDKVAEGASDVQSKLSNFGRKAKNVIDENISATADYVREHDSGRMMQDLKRVVRNNPGPSLLAAVAVGYFVGRSVTRKH